MVKVRRILPNQENQSVMIDLTKFESRLARVEGRATRAEERAVRAEERSILAEERAERIETTFTEVVISPLENTQED